MIVIIDLLIACLIKPANGCMIEWSDERMRKDFPYVPGRGINPLPLSEDVIRETIGVGKDIPAPDVEGSVKAHLRELKEAGTFDSHRARPGNDGGEAFDFG